MRSLGGEALCNREESIAGQAIAPAPPTNRFTKCRRFIALLDLFSFEYQNLEQWSFLIISLPQESQYIRLELGKRSLMLQDTPDCFDTRDLA